MDPSLDMCSKIIIPKTILLHLGTRTLEHNPKLLSDTVLTLHIYTQHIIAK